MDIIKDYGRQYKQDINPNANDKEAMLGTAAILLGGLLLGNVGLNAALKKGPAIVNKLEKFVSNFTERKTGIPPGAAEYIKYEEEVKAAAGDPQAWEAIKELLSGPGTTALAKLHNVYKTYGSAGIERIIKEYERVVANKGKEPIKLEKKPAAPRRRSAPKKTEVPAATAPVSAPPVTSGPVEPVEDTSGYD